MTEAAMEKVRGVAVLCDEAGTVTRVVRDDLGLCAGLEGRHFSSMLDPASREKAVNFFLSVQRDGAAMDWDLNVAVAGDADFTCTDPQDPMAAEDIVGLHFAGGVTADGALILGSSSSRDMSSLYEELVSIGNEQASALRQAQKEAARAQREAQSSQEGPASLSPLYDELSKLNNELMNAQRELHKANRRLARLNEEKNMLLGMAAHDLRNPLGVIMSYAEFLEERFKRREDRDDPARAEELEMVTAIHGSSAFMKELVSQLLEVTRLDSGQVKLASRPTNMPALVRGCVTLSRILAQEAGVGLRLDAPEAGSGGKVMLDPGKIEQVVANLLSNAIKYTRKGTYVDTVFWEEAERLELSVTDHGPGVPAADRDRIFEPFQRVSGDAGRSGAGGSQSIGLGLAIVKRIVTAHGGEIWVQDRPDGARGADFRVSLPRRHVRAVPEGAAGPLQAPLREANVLVVDDDEVGGMATARLVERDGHHVVRVKDAAQALEAAAEEHFDLALVDLHLPDMPGDELVRRLRQRRGGGLAVYAVTGDDSPQARARFGALGLMGYLVKPVSPAELREAVAAAVAVADQEGAGGDA